jgi:hypothetical protein
VTWRILEWIEQEARELLSKALEALAEKIVDGPVTPGSGITLNKLPLQAWKFDNCPAIPFWATEAGDPDLKHILATFAKLNARGQEGIPTAYRGLSTDYTIDGQTHNAYGFLYGQPRPGTGDDPSKGSPAPTKLPLPDAEDFTLGWTTYQDVYKDSQSLVAPFADTLKLREKATERFWPTIATFGLPYNLLILSKVDAKRATELEQLLGKAWANEDMAALQAEGLLYEIDVSIIAMLEPSTAVDGSTRFAPGTVTMLKQDPGTKALTPIAITVATTDGHAPRVYTGEDDAWLYALQAAKTSITVWGIWLGHVYHWHIVTAAMQMTMYTNLPEGHPLYQLMLPQSQSLIDFDFILLTHLWGQISPPTPVPGYMTLLALLDRFACERTFFDDDPLAELSARGLEADDFTVVTQWDAYPVVGYLLDIWELTGEYVRAVVDVVYTSDDDVAQDGPLQAWMKASSDPDHGNVRGVPESVGTRGDLAKVLTSILYRVNVHGAGSLTPVVNPVLSFHSNFPPCLQSAKITEPGERLSESELLDLLPHTGTIGGMTTFYYTFAYSDPYEALIPSGGARSDPYFSGPQKPCNEPLFAFREGIAAFVHKYVVEWNAALEHVRRAPAPIPSYAENQAAQWPSSIEI